MSRLAKSKRNIIFGMVQQIVTLILTFVTRTVFIRCLSISLLGINSLFSNILTVLSLADLGFGTAILYSMYKPLAENDTNKLSSLMNYFRKIYFCIAGIVFIVGICLLPFLQYFVKENNIVNLKLYYCLFLLDSVVSYLLAYKVNIINADQKNYLIKKYTLVFNILKTILQCITLVLFKNFLVYLLIQIFCTFLTNLYGAFLAKKMYPYISKKNTLNKEDKKIIINNVKSLFIYKIGGIILNNTDNILISTIMGITMVGYYTNYITIITAITNITAIIFTTITYSVGNMIATEKKDKQLNIFYKIDFLGNFVFSFISICLVVLLNDLINCWIGKEYFIDNFTIIFIVINFYIVGTLNAVCMFRDTTGLFKKTKYLLLLTSILNLIFSILLGIKFGLCGIIGATAIARILTNFWYEPLALLKYYFNTNVYIYFLSKIYNIIISVLTTIIVFYLTKSIVVSTWGDLFFKTFCTVTIAFIFMLLFYFKSNNLKYYFDLLLKSIKKGNNITFF